ncbi:MAG TPA: helix-turn-helix transcriptional regulator [Candidatus Brocadiales bacterium]|nr:helix-turn-helix transcriptional regulator [Candidatus Brocadiales bacterium]
MKKREHRVMLPRFGEYLTLLRKSKKLKQGQVIYKSKTTPGCCKVSSSNISRYESGKTGDPSLAILRSFSIIYKTPLSNIVRVLLEEKYGIKLGEEAGAEFVKEPEPVYDLKIREIVGLLKKLNDNGLAAAKAAVQGFQGQERFCHID